MRERAKFLLAIKDSWACDAVRIEEEPSQDGQGLVNPGFQFR